jgi:hypothetical protein
MMSSENEDSFTFYFKCTWNKWNICSPISLTFSGHSKKYFPDSLALRLKPHNCEQQWNIGRSDRCHF